MVFMCTNVPKPFKWFPEHEWTYEQFIVLHNCCKTQLTLLCKTGQSGLLASHSSTTVIKPPESRYVGLQRNLKPVRNLFKWPWKHLHTFTLINNVRILLICRKNQLGNYFHPYILSYKAHKDLSVENISYLMTEYLMRELGIVFG